MDTSKGPDLPFPCTVGDEPPNEQNTLFGMAIYWPAANQPVNETEVCSAISIIDRYVGKIELDDDQKEDIRALYHTASFAPLSTAHIAKFLVQVWLVLNEISRKRYIRLFSVLNAAGFLLYASGKRDLHALQIAIRNAGALAMRGYFHSVDPSFHEGEEIEGFHLRAEVCCSGIHCPPALAEGTLPDPEEYFLRKFKETGWHPSAPLALTVTGREIEFKVPRPITLQALYALLELPLANKRKEIRRWRDYLREKNVRPVVPGRREGAKKGLFSLAVIDELAESGWLTQVQADRAYRKLL